MTYTLPTWVDGSTPLDSANFVEYNTAINDLDSRVTAAVAAAQHALTVTSVKTANYSANPNEYVPVDTTSGTITVTFPTAPANGTQVGVKQVVRGGTNTVTLQLGGSDKFNTTSGLQTGTLTLLNQDATLQYVSATAVWITMADDLPLSQLDIRYTGTLTSPDSSITVGGTTAARTVAVNQAAILPTGYSSGGQWSPNVYSTQVENTERDDVTGSLIMASGARTWLILLGLCPASTYASFKLYLSTAATGTAGVYTCALYSGSSLTNTSWSRLGAGNVTLPSLTGSPGIISTALAFTLASPAYVALEMVVTTAPGTLYPTFAGTPALALTGGSTFLNPASGCPVFGTLAATAAPASTLNPTTGFTNIAQKIWCALA